MHSLTLYFTKKWKYKHYCNFANNSLRLSVTLGRDVSILPEWCAIIIIVMYVLPLSDVGWTGSSAHTLVDIFSINSIMFIIFTCTPGAVTMSVQMDTTCCMFVDCCWPPENLSSGLISAKLFTGPPQLICFSCGGQLDGTRITTWFAATWWKYWRFNNITVI